MSYKTISVSDEAYAKLTALKKSHESFTSLFMRLSNREKPKLGNFYGKWVMSRAEEEKIFGGLESAWGKWGEKITSK
ncbi:MAG: hypothetical protein MSIBF_04535 [Candidatus Altiarchaeales archaeon IMC4]|nr:MAG: hypothetical protein MSIBF_04535 [Candidatus Altiarchaeales archaeon IMC4]